MKEYYLKIEDAAEWLFRPLPEIREWAERKNKSQLKCNGETLESGSVAKIDDVAAVFKITPTAIKNWAKKNNKPLLICEEIPVVEKGKYRKIKEISEMLGIPVDTIKRWVKAKKIPHHYWMGRVHLRFDITEIMEWANNKGYMPDYEDDE